MADHIFSAQSQLNIYKNRPGLGIVAVPDDMGMTPKGSFPYYGGRYTVYLCISKCIKSIPSLHAINSTHLYFFLVARKLSD